MSRLTSIVLAGLVAFSMAYPYINNYDIFIDYDIDRANQVWDDYDSHLYVKRTTPVSNTIEWGENLVEKNEIYLSSHWDVFVYEGELNWDEDPFDDRSWVFYYHSLRMVSHLMNAYELTSNITFLEKAQWFLESWMEENPNPMNQVSEFAWGEHSTANRISTIIYFWDYYRNSEIFDEDFAVELLNILRKHGEYTANNDNYFWGHNHGIYQDRALLQLAGMFPIFKDSDEWTSIANARLATHIDEGVTDSGVHKEHSPTYHYIVMNLFIGVNLFNEHYGIENQQITDLVYDMQEYLVHIAKPDGTIPMIGDSIKDKVMSISEDLVINEHLLYEITNGQKGIKIENQSIVYLDAGIAIFKNDWDNHTPLYFALFNAFHSKVHKQSDDLSFVLSYGQTDYIVDAGKYNYDESDPYRAFIRSVFAHNTISVDNQTYNFRNDDYFDNPIIESYSIEENYSVVRASHTIFDGVKITRTAIVLNQGAVFLHDVMESTESHSYSQIFNFGPDVSLDNDELGNLQLNSSIDDTSLSIQQLTTVDGHAIYNGSTDPIRGWQSTALNEVNPITSISYYLDGDYAAFSTTFNMDLEIVNVDISDNVYLFTFAEQPSLSVLV